MQPRRRNDQREHAPSKEFRKHVDGKKDTDETDIQSHAGLVPAGSDAHQFLSILEDAYDPSIHEDMPATFAETDLATHIRGQEATKTATRAVHEGNISQMSYLNASSAEPDDVSGVRHARKLMDEIDKTAAIWYLFGHMGAGKTDFAIWTAEMARTLRPGKDYEIGSNIRTLQEQDRYVPNYGSLMKWLAGGESVDDLDEIQSLIQSGELEASNKIFIFDEANSEASGYSDDAYETQKKLGVMCQKMRKLNVTLIVVGHSGKDIHPHIRRLSTACVEKEEKKSATFYRYVDADGNGVDKKFSISGIPATGWTYDTLDMSPWDWETVAKEDLEEIDDAMQDALESGMSRRERDLQIAMAYLTGEHPELGEDPTQGDLAEHYDLTRQRVSQIVTEEKERVLMQDPDDDGLPDPDEEIVNPPGGS